MLAFGARCTYLYRYTCTLHQRFISGQKKAFPVPYYWVVNRLKLVFCNSILVVLLKMQSRRCSLFVSRLIPLIACVLCRRQGVPKKRPVEWDIKIHP